MNRYARIEHCYLECKNASLQIVADILTKCKSPIWLVSNEKVQVRLEYMLWESLKVGVSHHLAASAPCLAYDLERLATLIRKALGDRYFATFQRMSKVHVDDVKINVFNDSDASMPNYKREHYVHVEVTGIFGVIDGVFNAGQRNWEGKGDICIKGKGRSRVSYAGRDIGNFDFDARIVADGKFLGSKYLKADRPRGDVKLCPITKENRTIFG